MKTSTKIIIIALIVILAFAGWKYYTSRNSITESTVTKSVPATETPEIPRFTLHDDSRVTTYSDCSLVHIEDLALLCRCTNFIEFDYHV